MLTWVQKTIKNLVSKNWNPSTCTCENGKYFESFTVDPVTTCDRIIEVTKTLVLKRER